jgi:hypothetical protein
VYYNIPLIQFFLLIIWFFFVSNMLNFDCLGPIWRGLILTDFLHLLLKKTTQSLLQLLLGIWLWVYLVSTCWYLFNQGWYFTYRDIVLLTKIVMHIVISWFYRFNGREIAEMPFIATNEAHRGKGICRLLMADIESVSF